MFNVNVPWKTHVKMPPCTITEHRASQDFPGLLTALSPQSLDNSWCAYSQIQVAHLARTQVSGVGSWFCRQLLLLLLLRQSAVQMCCQPPLHAFIVVLALPVPGAASATQILVRQAAQH